MFLNIESNFATSDHKDGLTFTTLEDFSDKIEIPTRMYLSLFVKIIKRSWQLPISVPSDVNRFVSEGNVSSLKWLFKYFKRRFFCFIFVEAFGFIPEKKNISPSHKRILWINWAASSLGDSLMDLSSRVLLADREVILLTHPKNADLYMKDDPVFTAVYTNPRLLVAEHGSNAFDIVICDSFSPRVLINKVCVAPLVGFCGMYAYVNGFEVHRTYFSFARMMELLSLEHISYPIRPSISVPDRDINFQSSDVCIALGGEWAFRTYENWLPIVEWLHSQNLSIMLIGSSNGIENSLSIIKNIPSVRSTVGQLTLPQVVKQIAHCKVFIGADGGLWHAACAIPVPTVVLFADCQIFDEGGNRVTRETKDMVCETLYDATEVSNIPSSAIIQACERLFARLHL